MSVLAAPFRTILMAFTAGAVLAACASPAGDVSVLQSSSVSFSPGATYAWAPISEEARAAADPRVSNDIMQERLRAGVDTALSAKGYRRVADASQAQLLVAYHVGLENRTETRVNSYGSHGAAACGFHGCVGGWGLYGPPVVDVSNINYTQGTVILDLLDRSSGKLAWRATSNKRIDKSDGTQEGINAIMIDMTKSLPGPTAG